MASKNLADKSSRNVYDFSRQLIEDCGGYVVYLKFEVLMPFKDLADMSSRNVHDFLYKQKAVDWLRVVHPLTSTKTNAAFY